MGLLSTLGTIGGAVASGGASLLPKAFKQDPDENEGTGEFHYADGSKKYWTDPELASTLPPPITSDVAEATPAEPVMTPAVEVVDPRQAAKDAAAKLATGGKQTLADAVEQGKAAQEARKEATYTPAVQPVVTQATAKEAAAKLAGAGPKPAAPEPEPEAKPEEDFSEREAIEKADEEELAARAPMHDLDEAPDDTKEAEKLEWKKPPALDDKVTDQTKTSYKANNMPSSQEDIRKSVARVLGKKATPEAIDLVTRQAYHESNKGQNAPGYNLFGIKAKESEPYVTAMTTEIVDGKPQRVQAKFKAYASLDESIADHNRLLEKTYPTAWEAAQKGDTQGFARGLKQGGKSGTLAYYTDDPDTYAKALEGASRGPVVPPGYIREGGAAVDPNTGQALPGSFNMEEDARTLGQPTPVVSRAGPQTAAVPGAPPSRTAAPGVGVPRAQLASLAQPGQVPSAAGALPAPDANGLVLTQRQRGGTVTGASAMPLEQQQAALRGQEGAYNNLGQTIRQNTISQVEDIKQRADDLRKDATARVVAATQQKQVEDGWTKNVDAKMKDLSDEKINPDKLYDDMGTFGSILAHVGMFLGGVASAVTHGPNFVMQYFQQAKEDNIQAQMKNKDSKYNDLVRQYGDHKAAAAALSLKMDQGLEDKVKANLMDEKSMDVLTRGRELLAANEVNKQKSLQELRDALYGKEARTYQEQQERPKGKDPLLADDLLKQTKAQRDLETLRQTSEVGDPLDYGEYRKQVEDYDKASGAVDDFGTSIKRVAGRLGLTITTDKNGRQVIQGKAPDVAISSMYDQNKALLDADWSRITRADVMGMPREPSADLQDAFTKSTERPFWDDRIIPQLQQLLDVQNDVQRQVDGDYHPLVVDRHKRNVQLPSLGGAASATPSLRLRGSGQKSVDAMGNPSG